MIDLIACVKTLVLVSNDNGRAESTLRDVRYPNLPDPLVKARAILLLSLYQSFLSTMPTATSTVQ